MREEVAEYYDEKDHAEWQMGGQAQDAQSIESDFQLKGFILSSGAKEILEALDVKELKISNLSPQLMRGVLDDLDLASDLSEMGLGESAMLFARRAVLTCNLSRSLKGFQQEKFIENIRRSKIEGLKNERQKRFWGR